MSLEYYRRKADGARVKKLNLREEYEAEEYEPPFFISLRNSKETGEYYVVEDRRGRTLAETWRQGVDAERIVGALNLFYKVKNMNLLEVLQNVW